MVSDSIDNVPSNQGEKVGQFENESYSKNRNESIPSVEYQLDIFAGYVMLDAFSLYENLNEQLIALSNS